MLPYIASLTQTLALSFRQSTHEGNLLLWENKASSVMFQLTWKIKGGKKGKIHIILPSASFNHPVSKYLHLTLH